MARYDNKVVLVTGAGQGIGRATAHLLGDEGASVAVLEVNKESGRNTVESLQKKGIPSTFVAADITRLQQVEEAAAAVENSLGPIDLLVNNAAFTAAGDLKGIDAQAWHDEIDINLNGTYHCIRAVVPQMVQRGRGAIVTISSVNGLRYFGNPAYSAAKAGLINLTQSVASEYGKHGIRCNAICPGTIRTDSFTWVERQKRDPEIFNKLARWYPLGRVGVPDDIAKAVAFLGSEDASFITGAMLPVDGGLNAGMNVMIEELTLETSPLDEG